MIINVKYHEGINFELYLNSIIGIIILNITFLIRRFTPYRIIFNTMPK